MAGTEGGPEPVGTCGNFPIFATLEDGADVYMRLINNRYNGGSIAWQTVFNQPTNVKGAYENGFPGGLVAYGVATDDGNSVTVTSEPFSPGSILTGTYAANEMIGSSPWNAGHYMRSGSPYYDTYPGRRLNVLLNNSGWAPKEELLP